MKLIEGKKPISIRQFIIGNAKSPPLISFMQKLS